MNRPRRAGRPATRPGRALRLGETAQERAGADLRSCCMSSAPPSQAADEQYLLRAARRGDVEAFGTLLERHELAMYRVALRMLGSTADAEDATQEAMLRAWRSIRRYRGESALSTWLYRITTNCCLTLIERRRPTAELDDDRHQAPHADPAAQLEEREAMTRLSTRSARCPPNSARWWSCANSRASPTRRSPRSSASRCRRSRGACTAPRAALTDELEGWR